MLSPQLGKFRAVNVRHAEPNKRQAKKKVTNKEKSD
jgi:hypothetical protein